MLFQISCQFGVLFRAQIVSVTAHQGQQSAVFRANRVKVFPAGQKVMIHDPDHEGVLNSV